MRSLNSSKLDLTGCVAPQLLCLFEARCSCHPSIEFAPSSPFDIRNSLDDIRESVVRKLIFGSGQNTTPQQHRHHLHHQPPYDPLSLANIEASRDSSDYLETSLQTDHELHERIAEFNRDYDSLDPPAHAEYERHPHGSPPLDLQLNFTPSDSSEDPADWMKNKKKSPPPAEETSVDSSSEGQGTGILKSAPQKESKKQQQHKRKHRVQFDESLNKFFDADYVILVRDEEYDEEYGRCECGNQFCYEECYYEDEEDEEFEHGVDSPRFDFAAAFAPPIEFVDTVTLSPPEGYKDGCCPHSINKISTSTTTYVDNKNAIQDNTI